MTEKVLSRGRLRQQLPRDDAGYEQRIKRANQVADHALSTSLAQDDFILKMGMTIKLSLLVNNETGEQRVANFGLELADPERLGYLATVLRPFQLEKENIYYLDVADGLLRFADERTKPVVEQLPGLWEDCLRPTMWFYAADVEHGELIPGGVHDARVADRVIYSKLVHADDASNILDHIDEPMQQKALSRIVGNWTAMVAHQQYVSRLVRPDLVPELTSWAGTGHTIFERFGYKTYNIDAEVD